VLDDRFEQRLEIGSKAVDFEAGSALLRTA
jgi:hypothetical protein